MDRKTELEKAKYVLNTKSGRHRDEVWDAALFVLLDVHRMLALITSDYEDEDA